MPNNGASQNNTTWPISNFHFVVNFGGSSQNAGFQEVSGLDVEAQIIEYRHGDSPIFSNQKMPGLTKFGNITLKRGIMVKDNSFFDWYNTIKMNTIQRRTVTIQLLDENSNAVMTWTLQNCWPTKISATDLKSDGNELAVETIELAHEGLKIVNQ